jgi:hypothetical protein
MPAANAGLPRQTIGDEWTESEKLVLPKEFVTEVAETDGPGRPPGARKPPWLVGVTRGMNHADARIGR